MQCSPTKPAGCQVITGVSQPVVVQGQKTQCCCIVCHHEDLLQVDTLLHGTAACQQLYLVALAQSSFALRSNTNELLGVVGFCAAWLIARISCHSREFTCTQGCRFGPSASLHELAQSLVSMGCCQATLHPMLMLKCGLKGSPAVVRGSPKNNQALTYQSISLLRACMT